MVVIGVMVTTMMMTAIMIIVSMMSSLPWILSIFCICIQGVCGCVFEDRVITSPHYDVELFIDLIMAMMGTMMDDGKPTWPQT